MPSLRRRCCRSSAARRFATRPPSMRWPRWWRTPSPGCCRGARSTVPPSRWLRCCRRSRSSPAVTQSNSNPGWGTFNELSVMFRKRFAKGLQATVNYQHSRQLNSFQNNAGEYKLFYGPTSGDYPDHFVITGSYELPFGHGQKFLRRRQPGPGPGDRRLDSQHRLHLGERRRAVVGQCHLLRRRCQYAAPRSRPGIRRHALREGLGGAAQPELPDLPADVPELCVRTRPTTWISPC